MEPALVGLLFADRIINEDNGKKGIIGTFNRFFAPQFPVNFPPWAIYAAVTNLQGTHKFSVRLVHNEDESKVVIPIEGDMNVPSIHDVAELIFSINNAVFPSPGKYNLIFSIGNEIVGSRVLFVDQKSD